jgi:sugar lactone lactonase YvrE
MPLAFTPLIDLKCRLGESPVYDQQANRLHFVDIPARQLHTLRLGDGRISSRDFDSEVCSLGLAASGRLVVALRKNVVLYDPASDAVQPLCTIEADRAETRLNDGKVGPDGAFWVGSMDERPERQPIGALYRVDGAGNAELKVEGVRVSNGLAWTADGEFMFHADSLGPWIDRWNFDRWTGKMSDRARFAEPDDATGRPDGGTCDAEGFYWSAGVSAGRLNRFAPDGQLIESHVVPAAAPTMPCFGGPDFRTLYLTSLREGRPAEEIEQTPLSGSLFAAAAPVAGFAPWRFLDV